MFNASGEAKQAYIALRDAIDAQHESEYKWRVYPPYGYIQKTQEELDYDEAMAELDKEFPTFIPEDMKPW